jgi:hypothetical protein
MYSWGWNKYGQTGTGDRQVVKLPRMIDPRDIGKDFVHIDCGDKHSVALNRSGQVTSKLPFWPLLFLALDSLFVVWLGVFVWFQ